MKTALALRWTARALSLALVALVLTLAMGEGPPPMFSATMVALQCWLLVLTLAGMLAAWKYELGGALAGLAGIGGFYLADFAASGFRRLPGGWVFPMMALIPTLFFLAWWRQRSLRQAQA